MPPCRAELQCVAIEGTTNYSLIQADNINFTPAISEVCQFVRISIRNIHLDKFYHKTSFEQQTAAFKITKARSKCFNSFFRMYFKKLFFSFNQNREHFSLFAQWFCHNYFFSFIITWMQWCLSSQQEASSCCRLTEQMFNHFAKFNFKIPPPPAALPTTSCGLFARWMWLDFSNMLAG